MKLKGPEEKKPKRLNLVVAPEVLAPLEGYQAYYRHTYGVEIDFGEMIVQLASLTVASDPAFKRWRREKERGDTSGRKTSDLIASRG